MKKSKILILLAFISVLIGSIWQALVLSDTPQLKVGGYCVTIYKSAVVISHPSQPGVFNTILPYDEAFVLRDGSVRRLEGTITQEDRLSPITTAAKNQLSLLKENMRVVLKNELQLNVSNQEGFRTTYQIRSSKNEIVIRRRIRWPRNYSPQEIAGLERGLIFDPRNELWLNSQPLRQKEAKITRQGVNSLKIINPRLPEALELKIHPRDTITIDFNYNLITVRKLFSTSEQEDIWDQQVLEVISAI